MRPLNTESLMRPTNEDPIETLERPISPAIETVRSVLQYQCLGPYSFPSLMTMESLMRPTEDPSKEDTLTLFGQHRDSGVQVVIQIESEMVRVTKMDNINNIKNVSKTHEETHKETHKETHDETLEDPPFTKDEWTMFDLLVRQMRDPEGYNLLEQVVGRIPIPDVFISGGSQLPSVKEDNEGCLVPVIQYPELILNKCDNQPTQLVEEATEDPIRRPTNKGQRRPTKRAVRPSKKDEKKRNSDDTKSKRPELKLKLKLQHILPKPLTSSTERPTGSHVAMRPSGSHETATDDCIASHEAEVDIAIAQINDDIRKAASSKHSRRPTKGLTSNPSKRKHQDYHDRPQYSCLFCEMVTNSSHIRRHSIAMHPKEYDENDGDLLRISEHVGKKRKME